jgi:ATP-binding cassette subfamily B protein
LQDDIQKNIVSLLVLFFAALMAKYKKNQSAGRIRNPTILALLKPYSLMIVFLIVFALLGNGFNLLIPKIISHGIDNFMQNNLVFKKLIIEFSLAAILIFIFFYFQSILQTYTSELVARDLRSQLSDKISRQDYSFVNQINPSRLLTNLTSDVDSVKMFVSQAIVSIFSSVFIILGASILLLSINWKLALAVLTIIPVIGGTFYFVFRKVRVLFRKAREVIDWLNKVINESILGAAIIRILNSQHFEYEKFLAVNIKSRNLGLSILRLFATLIPVITFVSNIATITVLALGGHFVINGNMTLGDFAAFNSYIAILIFPILVIGFMSNLIANASVSYNRIKEVLEYSELQEKGTLENALSGLIEMKNVSVIYGEKPALKEVSLKVMPGSKVAIIGPTAAGKTHLLYLLAGLIKPDDGTVEFDGKNINDYNKEAFYCQVGLVFQDSIIFNMSIRENIAFSDIVTDDTLEKAIVTAELKSLINALPDKLNTMVSERGASLSGGQKQRIMLARALATNPRILLLDDFTARIDKRTEKKIMENIEKNYPEMTIISVTQKIAPIEHYEQVILLMESEIIAAGTHQKLMSTCPEYVQIYNSQRSTSHYELQS